MQNGGARPGAGRKAKAEKYKQPIAKAEKKIVDKLPWLVDQALACAKGVPLVQSSPAINIVVGMLQQCVTAPDQVAALNAAIDRLEYIFSTPPDAKSIQYLMDRIMGKPLAKQEVTGEDGAPLAISVVEILMPAESKPDV